LLGQKKIWKISPDSLLSIMISEDDLLASSVHFDPPLYDKRAREHQAYLIPPSGSIVKGKGRVTGIALHRDLDETLEEWSTTIEVPVTLA
jgi:hypothetical protein